MTAATLTAALTAIMLATVPAAAQDALVAGPQIYKKVTENNRIRVLEATFKPGAKVGLHSHPDHLIYMLTDGVLVLKPVGRTPYEMAFKAGEALYLPAQTREAENDGDKPVQVLIVELKTPAAASARRGVKAKRTGRGKRGARRR